MKTALTILLQQYTQGLLTDRQYYHAVCNMIAYNLRGE